MAKYLRYATGVLLLISGVGLLLAPIIISALGASQSMASFVGILLVALGVTFVVTHFEDPDATLTGTLPGFKEKIGIYARGYVLLLGVLLGGGLTFVFYVLDPLETERKNLATQHSTLAEKLENVEKLHQEVSDQLKDITRHIYKASDLHETLIERNSKDAELSKVLASYFNNTSVPMRIALKCPGDGPQAPSRALELIPFDDGRFGLVHDPSQTRSRENSDDGIITLEGTTPGRDVILFSDADMADEDRILIMSISREIKHGAISALINLKNPELFKEMCVDHPETSLEDKLVARESTEAQGAACVPVSGPDGLETCAGEQQ